jgi:hypothetical protein
MSRKPPSNVVRYRTAQWCGSRAKGITKRRLYWATQQDNARARGYDTLLARQFKDGAELYKLQASQYDTVQ